MLPNAILPWTLLRTIKVPLLLLASTTHYLGLKSPNPPPLDKTNVYRGQAFERMVRGLVILVIANICPRAAPSLSSNMPAHSIVFYVGISAMISGAALRMWCYGTLGKLFTYEVSIQPEHELITSGPYAFARHPSYTGAALMVIGAAITCLAPGSFLNECSILETPIKWIVALWLTMAMFTFVSLRRRGQVEDEELRKVFGPVWHRYSQAVPHSFIPYLY
ncbi:hypothetical protein BU17DRAFT_37018 [Hysterangium stoloniferum]|nr:hypothetical protein BU17DRAFT_37018 [Hysterangium stoloniferum]